MILYPGQTNLVTPNLGMQISRPHGLSALAASLVAYWKLDEASGSRSDSIGSNTLTDNNTVSSTTGKVYGTAADFESSTSEFLSVADNTVVSTGDINFWFAGWFKLESTPSAIGNDIFGKWDVASNGEYFLEVYTATSQQHLRWVVSSNGTSATGDLDNVETISNATWYFFAAWHDATANQTGYRIGTQVRTLSYSGGVLDGTSAFTIGRAITTRYFDGLIGPVMMGKNYVPTTADLDFLYGSNNGVTLAQMLDY